METYSMSPELFFVSEVRLSMARRSPERIEYPAESATMREMATPRCSRSFSIASSVISITAAAIRKTSRQTSGSKNATSFRRIPGEKRLRAPVAGEGLSVVVMIHRLYRISDISISGPFLRNFPASAPPLRESNCPNPSEEYGFHAGDRCAKEQRDGSTDRLGARGAQGPRSPPVGAFLHGGDRVWGRRTPHVDDFPLLGRDPPRPGPVRVGPPRPDAGHRQPGGGSPGVRDGGRKRSPAILRLPQGKGDAPGRR